ncbi:MULTISPECIES: flagellar motor switch phosphatase FliY [Bacillus]|uniref:Flagellar motor switch protein FliN n=1 Tax=Bacillus infantis NRRL B-14911 TaxID=1367477 RepID=U5L901_9BACI|nr:MULTISPECIES: flagellar motor switch phosphatase FliY [Bacillus]AGX03873.1 flagellar motor switch protein FliN [Bacillus infantis NRRL B-14911]EAR65712.1 flagellar motor switch protein [Bacillus sp. NRRL B-14911]MCA1034704.1 flagellar motor switch phosphatase FliY [Bacillus infantis]MCP1158065.1 flagellar motor switch phosphatase FliY [Bacillus infantis]MDT0159379.1 flagellar motor switch phosphatase FliY [Bacillus sp. AG4(2022)]
MMSDDMLSQDEIDALLRGTDDTEEDDIFSVEDYLSMMEQDALGEIGNISFGSSATALSTLLNQKVEITTPTVSVILKRKLQEEFPHPYVAIQVSYTEGFSGSNLLVIKQSDAAIIADLMLGGDGLNPADLLGEIQLSAVQEAMNQMMGSAATSMSTIFSKRVDISPPSIDFLDVQQGEGTDRIPDDDMLVKVSFRLKIGDLIDSSIMQVVPLEFAKRLVEELMNPGAQAENPAADLSKPDPVQAQEPAFHQPPAEPVPDMAAAPPGYGQGTAQYSGMETQTQRPAAQAAPQHLGAHYPGGQPPQVQPAVFSNFEPQQLQESETKNLNMLLDIPLQVTVELGRTKRSVKDILELSAGSIIELDKLAGEPVDILVNSRLIAKGEVVVIEENFGVRVTDIISQSDRIKNLR